ncbi:MAG TPA: DUF1572 family protein [Gemmatimonadales bacterium]|nr:DUF1572 family protein [Gemmatimonadales bacterium]
MADFRQAYLADMRSQFAKLRSTAERAMAQVGDDDFAKMFDEESNSIAITVKHISGNLRSRCTNFLTSDGEKPDRDRDDEFVLHPHETRTQLMHGWSAAWDLLVATVTVLTPDDLERTIYIRAEPHTVVQALNRNLAHLAYHVGQIVLLAKHWVGASWQTLTIARGQSRAFTPAALRNR